VNRDPAAQLSGLSDHALPRQPIGGLARLQRGRSDACSAGKTCELGDLSVRRDVTARDLSDDRVHAAEQLTQVPPLRR